MQKWQLIVQQNTHSFLAATKALQEAVRAVTVTRVCKGTSCTCHDAAKAASQYRYTAIACLEAAVERHQQAQQLLATAPQPWDAVTQELHRFCCRPILTSDWAEGGRLDAVPLLAALLFQGGPHTVAAGIILADTYNR
jgi:hypothetical protein